MADGAESEETRVSTFEGLVATDPTEAMEYFQEVSPHLSERQRLHCCLYLKESGNLHLADQAMQTLLEMTSDSPAAFYEAAIIKDSLGDGNAACLLLDRALALNPDFEAAKARQLIFAVKSGDRVRTDTLMATPDVIAGLEPAQLAVITAFSRTLSYWRRQMDKLDRPGKPAFNFIEAGDAIERALDEDRAFSLVRLGDGEGAFLIPDYDPDLRTISQVARRYFAWRWYGNIETTTLQTIDRFMAGMKDVIAGSDIAACPNVEWCRYEWNQGSFQTLASCLSARQYVQSLAKTVAPTSISLDLTYHKILPKLIGKARSVCLVTCHPSLAARLAEVCGEDKFTTVLIPPAHSDLSVTQLESGLSHLDLADDILRAIDDARGSQMFLVGGGFLGKFYTHRAAQGGAVAVDVGSVLDAIMDYQTRPNFGSIALADRFWQSLSGGKIDQA